MLKTVSTRFGQPSDSLRAVKLLPNDENVEGQTLSCLGHWFAAYNADHVSLGLARIRWCEGRMAQLLPWRSQPDRLVEGRTRVALLFSAPGDRRGHWRRLR